MKKVIISLIDYNGHDKTISCLESLNALDIKGLDVSVVIIDNYPPATFILPDKKFNFSIEIIKTKINLGFSGGHNVGVEYARKNDADYVLILNNDTTVDKNMLVHLVAAAEMDPKRGAILPKIYFAKGHEYHKDWYKKEELGKVIWYAGGSMDWNNVHGSHRGVDEVDKGQYDTPDETSLMTGCCVLIPMRVITAVGGFDERYFLYYEDADLNERMKQRGYTIFFEPKAILWHLNAGSTGGSGSKLHDYFISRNRMLFGMRFAPLRTRIALIRESLRLMQSGREWQKKGIRDFYMRRFGKGSYQV